jgi:hypothetical protein
MIIYESLAQGVFLPCVTMPKISYLPSLCHAYFWAIVITTRAIVIFMLKLDAYILAAMLFFMKVVFHSKITGCIMKIHLNGDMMSR